MKNPGSSAPWRLIPPMEATGEQLMAIDRWLLQQHRLGKHPPALRFYTWSPVAISLGYHQRHWPKSWENLTYLGQQVDLVRRPSGGRAVLHQGDLTYMVVTSEVTGEVKGDAPRNPHFGNRLQAYQEICQFLIQGFLSLGIHLDYGTRTQVERTNPPKENVNCFGLATGADLVLPDRAKLIGSAQLRSQSVADAISRDGQQTCYLQHGSIQLQPDPDLFCQVFGAEAFAKIGRSDRFPLSLPRDRASLMPILIDALVQAAQDCWGVEFYTQPLTEAEWAEIGC
jgi:lipoate---protein ligase